MEARRRKRRPGVVVRTAMKAVQAWEWCVVQLAVGGAAVNRRLRPWKPVVLVDARGGRARRLRRMVTRATRTQFRALGVAPPAHLLIVVQRTVHEARPLAALLQVFEDSDGMRRQVLFLALSVDGESLSDGEVVAMLRQQLHQVVAEALGRLTLSAPCDSPRAHRSAPILELRHGPEPPPFEEAPPPDDSWERIVGENYPVAAER